jgi:formamidopyrimidine-DNA glycosylase
MLARVPEILEVERYRLAAEPLTGRTIRAVDAPDLWYLKRGLTPAELTSALTGQRVEGIRRRGKLLMVDTNGPVLGLRFGMTGRLLVDGGAPVAGLEYGPERMDPAWRRLELSFVEGGSLAIDDARRLGGVELWPDEAALGPDALSISRRQLAEALHGGRAPIKAALLDQTRVAGIGNLLADEVLWRAGIDPARLAGSLDADEVTVLHRVLQLMRRGGSHTGDLQLARQRGAMCPRDGTPLERRRIGGRTTYSCPAHQR